MSAVADARRAELYATLARAAAEQARAFEELAQLEATEAGVRVDVAAQSAGPGALYATAEHNPLGSPRAFLNAHRSGAFPTFKRGRTIAARWADVEAWMQDPARRTKRPANDLATFDDEAALLAAFASPKRRRKAG